MTFYVSYAIYSYDEITTDVVLDTIEEVLALLNEHASNPDFTFTVIEGRLVEFEPIELVKAYKVKGSS